MIISPPFLPTRIVAQRATTLHPEVFAETEADWLERAMAQSITTALYVNAPQGSYPISDSYHWHTGLNIVAPFENGGPLPVRAIADGTVIYIREPAKVSTDPAHPLNFSANGKPFWSYDGCVILKHVTDIGSLSGRHISLTYYSLTMHLSSIDPGLKRGGKVWRKDVLGKPGGSYGGRPGIHFEICFDEANLTTLIGRKPEWFDYERPPIPTADGRTDVVFGDMYIYLPASTPFSVPRPQDDFRPVGNMPNTIGVAQWVQLSHRQGNAQLTSYDLQGRITGEAPEETQAEYRLYATAIERHEKLMRLRPGTACSPSGMFELLRYGRNLGPDPLPRDIAHWRQVHTRHGVVWVDLNTPLSYKLSDGDFVRCMGWNCIKDDRNLADQRCQSADLRRLIQDPDPKNLNRGAPDHLPNRLGLPEVRTRMRRMLVNFTTEWDRATVEQRHRWICGPENGARQVTEAGWKLFAAHARALTMDDLPEGYKNANWWCHPTEFISTMRKCTWLSEGEFKQLIPEKVVRGIGAGMHGPFIYEPTQPSAGKLLAKNTNQLNAMMRKFGIVTPQRMAAFVANSIQETAWWSDLSEKSGEKSRYAPWYGRGFLQLTNPSGRFESNSNYARYFSFRRASLPEFAEVELRALRRELSEDGYDACASAGAYWSWMGANKIADEVSENKRIPINVHIEKLKSELKEIVIYGHAAFRRAACAINLPSHMDKDDPQLMGLVDRYSAFVVAQVILMDSAMFPTAKGELSRTPETFASKRKK